MKRHLILAAALLCASAAMAQQGSESAERDLWCGLALDFAAGERTADAPERQQALIARYDEGARMLIERAAAAWRQAGGTDAGFAARRDALEAEIVRQLAASEAVPYSFQDCSALLDP